ncbi:cytochrome b562 [Pectobacteriaceae bacterium CE70]|uniref:Cytochrome b562 n=1 Tax=Serratia sp. (strain ATCC 39006) TaxID=104623 RepID=A0A2I5TJC0_SERS3|nr:MULTISPECIES: cytochrome b562 [Enterobacterales]WJV60969.1 cytochrome b562 [Pectobacteriaceae bacterium C52]WJV68575.1 cytochrome b562 [Pectobacteriaceae bacterium CE70]WJY12505.1 cytochrome b562 [Pectobacteriaceae bacterium C80]AUH00343.1 cytochrome b562 [Serratia sp. ATCC 39006]AUH04663.1 cytochrome b562 [Serratia sp. ATCC 39006]
MKKTMMTICLALSVSATMLPYTSIAGVNSEMHSMQKNYSAASTATDAATLKADLLKLKEHANKAKADPGFTKDKVFNEGLTKLIKQIDDAIALVDAGKLKEAKVATANIRKIRDEYHRKLGV